MPSSAMPTSPIVSKRMPAGSGTASPKVANVVPVGPGPSNRMATSLMPVNSGAASSVPSNSAATNTAPGSPVAIRGGPAVPGRLTRRAEFLRVAAKGRKAPMPGLVLQALKRDDDAPARLGFTVTKKVGNAVIRNRTRRRLREAARLVLREQPVAGTDLVLIGRDATRSRDFAALREDLRRALGKAGLL